MLGFVLILEHSFWFSISDRRLASILAAFRVHQSSFSAAVQTAIARAFPEIIANSDTLSPTTTEGIISRLLDVIMANRLRQYFSSM